MTSNRQLRHPMRHPFTSVSRVLLVAYVVVVGLIVFWPTPVDRPVHGEVTAAVNSVQRAGATAVTYSSVEIAANVAMFVPVGALLVLSFARMPWWLAIVICGGMSSMIELSQLMFIAARAATVIDIVANTSGGAMGAVGAVLLQHWFANRRIA
jgi:glycopeptide antibiotics resistance protein